MQSSAGFPPIDRPLNLRGLAEELAARVEALDEASRGELVPALERLALSLRQAQASMFPRPSTLDGLEPIIPETGIPDTAVSRLSALGFDTTFNVHVRASERRERARAAEFAALMDAVPALIWITRDAQSREVVGNRYGSEFLRRSAGENLSITNAVGELILPTTYRIMKDGCELDPAQYPLQFSAATGVPLHDYEFDMVFNDGLVAHLIGNVAPLSAADGSPAGAVGAFLDITSLKNMELALRDSEKELRESERVRNDANDRFRLMAENIPQLAWMADQSGSIFWFNQRWFDYTGTTLTEVAGWGWQKLHHPEHAERVVGKFRQCIEIAQVWEDTFPLRGKDGEYRWFLSRAMPVYDELGCVVRWFGTHTDITEMRLLEQEIIAQHTQVEVQRQLLEHREKERQEIARDIHDGPVQSLVGILFNLQLERAEIGDDRARGVVDQVMVSLRDVVQELRDVVNELRPPALLRFGLARAIQIYSEDFRASHPELGLNLDLVEDASLLSEDACLAFYRIFQESLNNIVRHANAHQVWVRFLASAKSILLEIQDDGEGFALPRDWLDLARRNHYGIAGMHERIEALGGKFSISSQPGRGTTVRVTLPRG